MRNPKKKSLYFGQKPQIPTEFKKKSYITNKHTYSTSILRFPPVGKENGPRYFRKNASLNTLNNYDKLHELAE